MLHDLEQRAMARPRVPVLGQIKLGTKENGVPRDSDHFVIPEDLYPYLGKAPSQLAIILPFKELALNFDTERGAWFRNKTLKCCSSDGIKARYFDSTPKEGQPGYREIDCQGDACPVAMAKQCRVRGQLRFLLLDVMRKRPEAAYGIYTLTTGDRGALASILFTLRTVMGWASRRPDGLAGLPFLLERVPTKRTIHKPGDPAPSLVEKYPVRLSLDPLYQRYLTEALTEAATNPAEAPRLGAHS